MPNELLFRIIFSALYLCFFAVILYTRYESRGTAAKSLVRRRAQKIRERDLRIVLLALLAPFWYAGLLLYALLPSWIAFLSINLPAWLRLAMACVAAAGLAFAAWGYEALGTNWVHAFEPETFRRKKRDALVTSGPYHYVRNPIYLGVFTMMIALALLASNWLVLLPEIVILLLVYRSIGDEEKMLTERFGKAYLKYMKRTPRLIPCMKCAGL